MILSIGLFTVIFLVSYISFFLHYFPLRPYGIVTCCYSLINFEDFIHRSTPGSFVIPDHPLRILVVRDGCDLRQGPPCMIKFDILWCMQGGNYSRMGVLYITQRSTLKNR